MNNVKLLLCDEITALKTLPEHSIALAILKPPHSFTKENNGGPELEEIEAKLPMKELFDELTRVLKPHSVALVFGGGPKTSLFIKNQNIEQYRYDLYWDRQFPSIHDHVYKSRNIPLAVIEPISVFSELAPRLYPEHAEHHHHWHDETPTHDNKHCLDSWTHGWSEPGCFAHHYDFPITKITVPTGHHSHWHEDEFGAFPVELIKYLIRLYSVKNETILIPFAGTMNGVIAGIETVRNVVAIESNPDAFIIGRNRIDKIIAHKADYFLDWVDCREDQTKPLPDDPEGLGGKD